MSLGKALSLLTLQQSSALCAHPPLYFFPSLWACWVSGPARRYPICDTIKRVIIGAVCMLSRRENPLRSVISWVLLVQHPQQLHHCIVRVFLARKHDGTQPSADSKRSWESLSFLAANIFPWVTYQGNVRKTDVSCLRSNINTWDRYQNPFIEALSEAAPVCIRSAAGIIIRIRRTIQVEVPWQ